MADFALHGVNVAGGILALCQMPGRSGDYDGDLSLIKEWRPSLVMTLTSKGEMVDAGAEQLGTDIQESGARWVHLPVPDMGVPDDVFEEAWTGVQQTALAALQGGGRVLVHCLGGCGRSGMIAMRLMVDAGETPETALDRLRVSRPCAVETPAQQAWASQPTVMPEAE